MEGTLSIYKNYCLVLGPTISSVKGLSYNMNVRPNLLKLEIWTVICCPAQFVMWWLSHTAIIPDQSDNNGYKLFTVGLAYPRLLIVDHVLHTAGSVLNHSINFCLLCTASGVGPLVFLDGR